LWLSIGFLPRSGVSRWNILDFKGRFACGKFTARVEFSGAERQVMPESAKNRITAKMLMNSIFYEFVSSRINEMQKCGISELMNS
jgi:hypothetical protein